MLDMDSIKARAASRLALARDTATPANPANRLMPDAPISQLATLATPAARNPGRYALTPAESDAAHADAWDDATIARFQARVAAFRRRGFAEQDADDLAERSHLLDVQAEGRALCLTCRHLAGAVATGWRCGNHRAAGVARDLAPGLVTTPQRCPGFKGALQLCSYI